MKEDLVSVIIPVYNTKKELFDKCIESVITQTYKNIEIIIIDDGSAEDTALLCDSYAKKDPRIKVIHKKNEGVSIARNIGIKEAKGEWLFFVDSDDSVFVDAIEKLVLNSNGFDVIIGKTKLSYEKVSRDSDKRIEFNKDNKELLYKSIFISDNPVCNATGIWSKLIRKEFVWKNDIKFNPKIHYGEDILFNLSLYSFSEKVLYIPENVYIYYLENSESVTQRFNPNLGIEQTKMLKELNENFPDIVKKYETSYLDLLHYLIKKEVFFQIFHDSNKTGYFRKVKELKNNVNNGYYYLLFEKFDSSKLGLNGRLFFKIIRLKWYFLIFIYIFNCKHYKTLSKIFGRFKKPREVKS